jgi:diadenylate cyclase
VWQTEAFSDPDGPMLQVLINYLRSIFASEAYSPGQILLEMSLIGVVIYSVLRFLHGTRGARLLQGMVILVVGGFLVVNVLAEWFRLERISVLYQPFLWAVLLATLVVFQPELRRGLMRLGETRWRRISQSEIDRVAMPVAMACTQLSKNKIGALIAIERDVGLAVIADEGVRLDARLSPELLNTIFWPGSALHDLGVVIQNGRIMAAGCEFPLMDADGVDRSMGSRHRAAIGLSLESDAIVVVVSEETGSISIAERGELRRHIRPDNLYDALCHHLSYTRVPLVPREDVAREAEPESGETYSPPEAKEAGDEAGSEHPEPEPPVAALPSRPARQHAAEASL